MSGSYRTVYAFAREMHPKTVKQDVQYGTAGFRTKASNLGYVMYRMGLLAVLRSRYKQSAIGIMITASHNPEADNGVKLVDPQGEMMEQSWEEWATKFANVGDDELEAIINEMVTKFSLNMKDRFQILVGKDTRPSSPSLAKSAIDGILALSGKAVDCGIVTTPQLHYLVACTNNNTYGSPTEEGYFSKLVDAFKLLRGVDNMDNGNYKGRIMFDGANGVGAKKIKVFQDRFQGYLKIDSFNEGGVIGQGKLNHLCGADFVKVQQTFPTGLTVEKGTRCASVDGDADRIVYFYADDDEKFHLLDGDRIATLIAGYLKECIEKCGFADGDGIHIGLVQTAYANGASTEYIAKGLKVPVACVSTGVKHLHHKALDFDVGVYFEANGHGTVTFSDACKCKLKEKNNEASKKLLALIDVINETVGDAISDMLLVETILHSRGWSIQDWEKSYTDLPNRQLKVVVEDRRVVTVTDAERVCVTPNGLQDEINALVAQYEKGRAFVRASGTEDVVRIYAEAKTRQEADKLAAQVALKVYQMAGGTGNAPQVPA